MDRYRHDFHHQWAGMSLVFEASCTDEEIARKVGWCDRPLYFMLSYTVHELQPDTVEVLRGEVVRRFNRLATTKGRGE